VNGDLSKPWRFDTLLAGFVASVTRWPGQRALLLGDESWTYQAIDAYARRLAAGLLRVSNRPKRVGILARRSLTSYTAVIGALFSGAAFVPLNPTLPAARLRAIANAAELDAIICENRYVALLQTLFDGQPSRPPVVLADAKQNGAERIYGAVTIDLDDLRTIPPVGAAVPVAPEQAAYILFTSGSTGVPKGVPISHANVVSFLNLNLDRYMIEPTDVLSQMFEQSFDLSVFDIFMAWSAGATLCGFTPTELLAPLWVVQSRGVTVWFSVPSVVAMQIKLGSLIPGCLPSLRLSLFCGEPLVREHAEAWQRAAPASVLENLYGPTELTIACAAHRWDPATSPGHCANGVVPIGRPYATLSWQIVNQELEPVRPGENGELCITGPQMFAGYWRNLAATMAAFYETTDRDGSPTRYYRTGDLVRELPSGELVFIGRRDHQIKLGGHRIELGDIEAALRVQPGVVEVAAFAWPPGAVTESIVAAVSGNALEGEALRLRLRNILPAYMVPAEIEIIESMPRTSSGKLDRRALSDILANATKEREDAVNAR
jgi:amino acid adenylation domain-containing protein